jgi:hypothetical protein
VEPFATEVSNVRGLKFDEPVVVQALPIRAYAEQLAATTLGITTANQAALAGEWRSVGLLTGELDTTAIGMAAVADAPAYYDPATTTVFVVQDLPEQLRHFAIDRALTMALLDQHMRWSERIATANPSEALAVRAVMDADAIAVAREALGSADADLVAKQMADLAEQVGVDASPSVWASALIGRAGLPLQPTFAALSGRQRMGLYEQVVLNDGALYDPARIPTAGTNRVVTDAEQSRGMMYWYHALASRIGSSAAWAAATRWNGDRTVVSQTGATTCVSSTIADLNPNGDGLVLAAFQQWAAAAAPESVTEVAGDGAGNVTVKACDPGAGIPTGDSSAVIPFGGASVERVVVALGRAGTTNLTDTAQTCLVAWARLTGGDLAFPADSPPMIEPSTGWSSPYVSSHVPPPERIAACRATP